MCVISYLCTNNTNLIQIFSHSKLQNAFYNHSRSLSIQCSNIHSSLKLSGDGFTHFRMVEVIFFSLICWRMFLFFVEFLNCFDHKLWWSLLLIIIIPRTRWKYSSVYSNGVEIKERLEVVKVSVFSMYNIVKEIP